jgi:hypothetical protein
MKLVGRILIILLAVALVVGGTYAFVQFSGGSGLNFERGNGDRPGDGQFFAPNGQQRPEGGFDQQRPFDQNSPRGGEFGEGRGGGFFAFFGLLRNLFVVAVIVGIVVVLSLLSGQFKKLVTNDPPEVEETTS